MTYKFKLIYVKIKIGDSMASRMERFHNQDSNLGKRVQRNKDLYKHIYDDESYSNIEGVFETDSNTVNINKLKETIEKHEKLNNDKKQLVKRDVDLKIPQVEEEPYDEENYNERAKYYSVNTKGRKAVAFYKFHKEPYRNH